MTTSTVGSGQTYATWALWVASFPATLASDQIGQLTNSAELSTSASAAFTGFTPAGFQVILEAQSGQSFRDNANKLTNALRYAAANGAAHKNTGFSVVALDFSNASTTFIVRNLQFSQTGTGGVMLRQTTSTAITIDSCIFEGIGTLVRPKTHAISNCLFVVTSGGGTVADAGGSATTDTVDECTFVNLGTASASAIFANGGQVVVLKNSCAIGFTNDFRTYLGGSYSASSTNNATSRAASFSSANLTTNAQFGAVAATEFVSATTDFRLASGSVSLKDLGATTGPSVDIVGTSRPQGSAYDIGCWELTAAAGDTLFAQAWM